MLNGKQVVKMPFTVIYRGTSEQNINRQTSSALNRDSVHRAEITKCSAIIR
jgi:hypothetical protein